MRKHRWIAPVWGMLATAAFGQASAQSPASPLDAEFPPAAPPAGAGGMPYAGSPTYTPVAPDPASPAGYPGGDMRPWPTISPYDHAYDSTYNQDGIWFREMLGNDRKVRMEASFISGRFRQPGNTIVGTDIVKGTRDPFDTDGVNNSTTGLEVRPFTQAFVGAKQFLGRESFGRYYNGLLTGSTAVDAAIGIPPFRAVAEIQVNRTPPTGTTTGGGTGNQTGNSIDFTYPDLRTGLSPGVNLDNGDTLDAAEISNTVLFVVDGGVLAEDAVPRLGGYDDVVNQHKENPSAPGLRLVFGVEDEDQSGVDITGWWLQDSGQTFSRGTDDPTRLRPAGVVLFDIGELETDDEIIDLVEVLDYNQLFRLEQTSQAAGTDLALYHTPMVDYGWLVMRPLYGARYNYIREQFNFTGRDTGQFVVFDQFGRPTTVSDTETAIDDPLTLFSLFPYETSVTSKVQSHLYGPQVGLDMKLGGEYLMINSAVKTGVVANTEKLSLGAYGFGTQEALTGQRAFFSDSKTHTRVAPFLEFSTNADINVFPIIPYVNRWGFFKNARLNAGWSTLVVGNIQRPMDQIVWRSEAIGGPHIKERGRDVWYMQNWNLGVSWRF